jgi:HK97 family phage portal protein
VVWFPGLRKVLGGSEGGMVLPAALGHDPQVKYLGARYVRDLQSALSSTTGRDWPIDRAVAEGYERLVWVFKPVDTIGDHQSARRFVVREGENEVEGHPLSKLMNGKANPLESGKVLRKRLSAQALLSPKGVFVEVTSSNAGTPIRLDLLPPGRMRIVPGDESADPMDTKALVDHYELAPKDGIGRPRSLEPEQVRWIRNPHPLDPYRAVTPLAAASLSVELDHFARLYNVMFLRNDGRPGGIVAVHGDMEDDEMEAIERKFDKGPAAAGRFTVLSAEGLSFIDPSGKPRDMSYAQLSRNAKIELLSSFGVAESVMGFSGDKTFANAEQELLAFWTLTMPPHLSLIADGFDDDVEDAFVNGFDLSDVPVLQKAKIEELARMQAEVVAGVRSPYSYAQASGQTEVESTPSTRAWYITSGKTALPTSEDDAKALGLGASQPAAGGAADPNAQPATPDASAVPGPGQGDVGAAPGTAQGGSPEGSVPSGPGAASASAAASRTAITPTGGAPGAGAAALAAAQATSATQTKALPVGQVVLHVVGKADTAVWSDDADETARDLLEEAVAEALRDLTEKWIERASQRLGSAKSRRYTRHWTPQGDRPVDARYATKAVDPNYAVDPEQWQAEAQDTVSPILVAAAVIAATATWNNLTGGGLHSIPRRVTDRAGSAALEIAGFLGKVAARAAERLIRVINEGDQAGLSMDDLLSSVRSFSVNLATWAEGVAVQTATAVTEQARHVAAVEVEDTPQPAGGHGDQGDATDPDQPGDPVATVVGPPITGTTVPTEVVQRWRSRRDNKVRETHQVADGQQQPLGGLFEVGGFLLRFPGDPLAPAKETANCRCTINYRSRRTGRYMPRPNDPPMEAAQ